MHVKRIYRRPRKYNDKFTVTDYYYVVKDPH